MNNQWLPWLPSDTIKNFENSEIDTCNFAELEQRKIF